MKPLNFTRDEIQTVQDLLRADGQPVPPIFLEESTPQMGTADIPKEVFLSQSYHDLEVEKLWKKVWQMACREEDLPKVGDHIIYEIADLSIIVVRSASNQIRAFYNACLHRGTQLRISNGHVPFFQCPFHGWRWNLDGSIAQIPCRWEFDHVDNEALRLPEIKVETWQGMIFVNFDPECQSLASYLENIPEQFRYIPFPPQERYTFVHMIKEMPANWKVTLAAFVESYHFSTTHPQVLPFTGIAQNDVYQRHSRTILPVGVASPYLGQIEPEALAKKIALFEGADPSLVNLPQGMTARAFAAHLARQRLQQTLGIDCSSLLDTDVLDVMSYLIFPNLVITPSLGFPVLLKFMPNGNDPNSSLMEVRLLLPCAAESRPAKVPIHRLGVNDSWAKVPGFEKIGPIFDQDTANLHRMQRGLKASAKLGITLSKYQESIIRHFHQVLDCQLQS